MAGHPAGEGGGFSPGPAWHDAAVLMKGSIDTVKTHKGSAKRFRVGARGRVKAAHSGAGHMKSGKSPKRRRRIRRGTHLKGALIERLRPWMRRG